MAKNAVSDYDTTPANNTDVGGISINGSDDVANFDNAFRQGMAHQKTESLLNAKLAGADFTGDISAPTVEIESSGDWSIDGTTNSVSIANFGAHSFTAGAGFLSITNNINGATAAFILGGGSSVLLGQSSGSLFEATNSTPTSGKIGVGYDSSSAVYRVVNNYGSSVTVYITAIRTRDAA